MEKEQEPSIFMEIEFPKNYKKKLDEIFEDELKIATFKWFNNRVEEILYVNGDRKLEWVKEWDTKRYNTIRENSFLQLENKVNTLAKTKKTGNKWDITKNSLTIGVLSETNVNKTYSLDPYRKQQGKELFERVKGEMIVVNEISRDTIKLDDFYTYILDLIEKWLRTAVFYCVASYYPIDESEETMNTNKDDSK